YETALGAALGDDLEAPRFADGAADAEVVAPPPLHWRVVETSPADPSLPAEAEPLAKHLKGPPELKRRMTQIGVVPRELGPRLQPHLKPGQRLVSREGDLWRWDGFVAAAEGATAAAQRLAQRNRLAAVEYDEAQAVEAAEMIAEAEALAVEALAAAEAEARALRHNWRATQDRLTETRERLTAIEQSARETQGRLAAINEARERAEDELQAALERESELAEALALADPADAADADLAAARAECDRWRAEVSNAAALLAEQQHARRARTDRLAAIAAEQMRWSDRRQAAQSQVEALRGRVEAAKAELDALAELPSNLSQRRDLLFSAIATAEAERRRAGDDLASAETASRDAQQALRTVQGLVSNEREARARIEARLEAARTKRQDEARRIRETLGVVPEGCLPLAGLASGAPLPPLADVDRPLTRRKSDRESLGGGTRS
ncbi:MAG: chromosome segregation protein SMC, partial [Hyphomicrobiaceae bacterium]